MYVCIYVCMYVRMYVYTYIDQSKYFHICRSENKSCQREMYDITESEGCSQNTRCPSAHASLKRMRQRAAIWLPYATNGWWHLPSGKPTLRPLKPLQSHTQLEHKGASHSIPGETIDNTTRICRMNPWSVIMSWCTPPSFKSSEAHVDGRLISKQNTTRHDTTRQYDTTRAQNRFRHT